MDEIGPYPLEHLGAMITRQAGSAALSAIPFAGSALSNIFVELFQAPLTESREAWFNAVSRTLNRIGADMEMLAHDPEFVDVVVVATEVARSTSQEQKRQWLANAVANCSRESAPTQAGRLRYLRMIERLLPIHIEILRFIRAGKLETSYPADEENRWPSDSHVIAREIDALKNDQVYASELFGDLVNLGLVRERSQTIVTDQMLDLVTPHETILVPDYELPTLERRASELLRFIEDPDRH